MITRPTLTAVPADPPDDFTNPPPFPQPDWNLINRLHANPPPVKALRPWDPAMRESPYIGEVHQQAVTAHAMLDMAGIPCPTGYGGDLDARVSTVLQVLLNRVVRLDKIEKLHVPETDNPGFCNECGLPMPCASLRTARGEV